MNLQQLIDPAISPKVPGAMIPRRTAQLVSHDKQGLRLRSLMSQSGCLFLNQFAVRTDTHFAQHFADRREECFDV